MNDDSRRPGSLVLLLTAACAASGTGHEPADIPIDINALTPEQSRLVRELHEADPTPYLMRSRPIVCQIVETPNDAREVRTTGPITERAEVLIYALGEVKDGRLVDRGRLLNADSGEVVWEMTLAATEHGGGDPRNRRETRTLWLEPGRYELHYETNDAHAFGDWRGLPPERELFYGVAVFNLAGVEAVERELRAAGVPLD